MRILLDAVRDEIARVLRLAGDAAPKKRDRLMDIGHGLPDGSRAAKQVVLPNSVWKNLPATLIYDYPTPDAIADLYSGAG